MPQQDVHAVDNTSVTTAAIEVLAEQLLRTPSESGRALAFASRRIAETAFHDFSQYVFLGDPYGRDGFETDGNYAAVANFNGFIESFLPTIYLVVAGTLPDRVQGESQTFSRNNGPYESYRDEPLSRFWLSQFAIYTAPFLWASYQVSTAPATFLRALHQATGETLINAIERGLDVFDMATHQFWSDIVDTLAVRASVLVSEGGALAVPAAVEAYRFLPYPTSTINFGLRLIYRQTWTPLGTQPGEIVRTIPLGPKQIEKVSVKVIRRQEETRSSEAVSSTETTRETSETAKDSSEVVAEASKSFNWNVETEASVNYGMFSGSMSAGIGGDSASSSKDTKSRLNETMEKTASKMRSDTKVVVSTRREETFEQDQSSEVSNANEEIAVTYVYSRLQRQYEIATRLAEVNTVILIPETVPHPSQIDGAWIRRHDWLIAKALLDDSFKADLAAVRAYVPPDMADANADPKIATLMGNLSGDSSSATSPIPSYTGYSDVFRMPQETYERELERVRARNHQTAEYIARESRLIRHIKDNILHYCRRIWSTEDPEARLMRFRGIRVPVRWDFFPTGQVAADGSIEGYYEPVVIDETIDTVPLSDIVNPAGPIGFAGNYSVYYVKPSLRWEELHGALKHLRARYCRMEVRVTTPRGSNGPQLSYVAVHPDRITEGSYQIEYFGAVWILKETNPNSWVQIAAPIPFQEGVTFEFDGIRAAITDSDGTLQNGDVFQLEVIATEFLQDPELKVLKWMHAPPIPADEHAVFAKDVIQDMAALVPSVDETLSEEVLPEPSWGELTLRSKAVIRSRFHDYLLAREHTRRFLLETNNLLVDLEVGETSALEEFKRLHRYVDVLKAFEEREAARVTNVRKSELMRRGRYGDPEVEKLTVVAGADAVGGLGVLEGVADEDND